MQIGIGLPNTIRDAPGDLVVEWARRAEAHGFSGPATIDRIVYPSYDSLITLAAAAGATSRIGLMTNILLAPAYPPVWLAKATASLDQLSAGRLTLGLAPGGRADDYAALDRPFEKRGRAMDEALPLLRRAWRQESVAGDRPVGPPSRRESGVPILIGGNSEPTIRRTVQWGAGWTAGGGGPDMVRPMIERIRAAWRDAGRDGEPRAAALMYFSLGEEHTDASLASLRDYYGFAGDWAERIAQGAARSPKALQDLVRAYEDAGTTELYFDPTVASLDQVDRLAEAVL